MQKITAIVATGTSPFQCFFRSMVSLLMRSDKELFDQIIVSINGPDSRTGEPIYQDKKQEFCEELAALGYPVTVVRAWSRVGFGQPYDMVTSLARTDICLFFQDDIIVRKDWMEQAFPKFFCDHSVTLMADKPLLQNKMLANIWDYSTGDLRLDFPYLNNTFMLCRTSRINRLWRGHYMNNMPPIDLNTHFDQNRFRSFWKKEGNYSVLPGPEMTKEVTRKSRLDMKDEWQTYKLITTGFGSWNYYDLYTRGDKMQFFSEGTVEHYEGMSWMGEAMNEVDLPTPILHQFRSDVRRDERFETLFQKYMPETAPMPDISGVRPLVGVIVYKRMDTIANWLQAWNNADKYGAKLAVFHTYDGDEPDPEQKENILQHEPDFYVPCRNVLGDLGVFANICEKKINLGQDWNTLFWFTDDIIPLRKDFLYPLIFEMAKPGMGMTGGWYNPENIRTVNFAISREAMEKLSFQHLYEYIWSHRPGVVQELNAPDLCSEQLFKYMMNAFVSRVEMELANMVRAQGYMVGPMTFRYSAKYVWDCDHEGIVDLWHKYEAQFDG